jgi:hypothetical protein
MDFKVVNASKGFQATHYKPNAHFVRLKVCKNHLKTQGKGLHAPGLA